MRVSMMVTCNLCLALMPLRPLLLLLIIMLPDRNLTMSSSFQVERIEEQKSRDNNVVASTRDVTSAMTEEQQECVNDEQYDYYLIQARELIPPPVESIENGDTESADWWMEHSALLQRAWTQWHQQQQQQRLLPPLNLSLIHI